MRGRPCIILVVSLLFFLGVSSCSTKREILIKSLPRDTPWDWFTTAKSIALTKGKELVPGFFYLWSSEIIYISGERTSYEISYIHGETIRSVMLSKKYGSLVRAISSYEGIETKYYVKDMDFKETVGEKYLTKEEAEGLAYNFFKELDKYGLE